MQKTFDSPRDVADSLQDNKEKVFNKPIWIKLALTDEADKEHDNLQFMMEWQVDCEEFKKESKRFCDNWVNVYALIWESYCSKEMQIALKEISDYESHIRDQPLVLLERIEYLIHTPKKSKYPPLILIEVLATFLKV